MSGASVAMASTAVAEHVRAARESGRALRIVGRGLWLDAGAPCHATERLGVGLLSGVVEYEPGDLTLTARAGTSLAEIAEITARHGQWLTLDPFGSPDGTLGATVATASSGPLASAFGTPRDQVLGCELVTGTGELVRAGGRVVKNVAGFDITRLVTGAWGTLGVLTEVAVRLRARPAVDRTLAISLDREDDAAERSWRWLRDVVTTPMAAELLTAPLAHALGLPGSPTLLLRFGGNAPFVRAATDGALALGRAEEIDLSIWHRLATAEPTAAMVVRLSVAPSRVGVLWRDAARVMERAGGSAHATLARGVVRCMVPVRDGTPEEIARLARIMLELPGECTRLFERLPGPLWSTQPSASGDELSRRVRRAFDPDLLLNPGIFGLTA